MKRAQRFTENTFSAENMEQDERSFYNTFRRIREFNNLSATENGAIGFQTTTKPLLDLNFMVSSLRHRNETFITDEFIKAYYASPKYAVKWLFFLRDIKQGLGERRIFRVCLRYLAVSHSDIARAILPLIPEYGRYDDLLVFWDTPLREEVLEQIKTQLQKDLKSMQKGKPASLLAKWLPSNNTSSAVSRQRANQLARALNLTDREYRKTLVSLRAYLDVCEVKISASRWSELDYGKIPAKANLKYENAFERHDRERRISYLKDTFLGENGIHTAGIQPYEIVHRLTKNSWRGIIKDDLLAELMWQKLCEDGLEANWGLEDCIVVADGSGSMFTPINGANKTLAIEVCNALAIYFSGQLKGIFHDKAITFSRRPQFIDLANGHSLKEKLEIMFAYNECSNTNIEAVFELLLQLAVSRDVPACDLPKQVLILSDMEFDYAADNPDANLFEQIKRRYAAAGYRMPRLIFWNLCGRSDTIPMVENGNGLCLLSGFSQNAIKTAADRKIRDPYLALLQVLDSPRYDKVENAIKLLAS